MERKDYYESIADRKSIWAADKKSNLYFQEQIRFDHVLKYVPAADQAHQVLDFGCGNGYLSWLVAQKKVNVVALDISGRRLLQFSETALKHEISQVIGSVTMTGIRSDRFDTIISSEVLEHITDYKQAMAEAFRLLKPGGRFIVTVPHNEPVVTFTCPHCLEKIYRNDHVNQFSRERLVNDLKEAGFVIEQIETFRSRLLNQLQYHLHLKYGFFVRLSDRILSKLMPNFTFYLLTVARKPAS